MYVVIRYEGNVYVSGQDPDDMYDKFCDDLYEAIDNVSKLRFNLKDGSLLILPSETIQRCVIEVHKGRE